MSQKEEVAAALEAYDQLYGDLEPSLSPEGLKSFSVIRSYLEKQQTALADTSDIAGERQVLEAIGQAEIKQHGLPGFVINKFWFGLYLELPDWFVFMLPQQRSYPYTIKDWLDETGPVWHNATKESNEPFTILPLGAQIEGAQFRLGQFFWLPRRKAGV